MLLSHILKQVISKRNGDFNDDDDNNYRHKKLKPTPSNSFYVACANGDLQQLSSISNTNINRLDKATEDTPLILACKGGHPNIVDYLIRNGADVTMTNSKGASPLWYAAKCGNLRCVQLLVEQGGADVRIQRKDDMREPLFGAAQKGHSEIAQYLLSRGATGGLPIPPSKWPKQKRSGFRLKHSTPPDNMYLCPPLDIAVEGGFDSIVKAILDLDRYPEVSLHPTLVQACRQGNINIVKMLIEKGASVNQGDGECSPLVAAVLHDHTELAKMLLQMGATVEADPDTGSPLEAALDRKNMELVPLLLTDTPDLAALHCLAENGELELVEKVVNLWDVQSEDLSDMLLIAAERGDVAIAEMLLKKGAKIIDDGENNTVLIAAHEGHQEMVELLLKNLKNPTLKGTKILHAAAESGNHKLVEMLLDRGAEVNSFAEDRKTPLHVAKSAEVVEVLLKNGANMHIKSKQVDPLLRDHGCLPLIEQCRNGNVSVVKALLDHGAKVDKANQEETPLLAAIKERHPDVVDLLLQYGANVEGDSETGCSPLLRATLWDPEESTVEVIKVLLKHGANTEARTDSNSTPLMLACAHSEDPIYTEIVKTLLEHGAHPNNGTLSTRPLMDACSQGNVEVVKLLIKHKAQVKFSINTKKSRNFTCLHALFNTKSTRMFAGPRTLGKSELEIAEILIENGVPVNAVATKPEEFVVEKRLFDPKTKFTALHSAIKYKFYDMIEKLMGSGADSSIPYKERKEARSTWALCGNDEKALAALKKGWTTETNHLYPKKIRDAIKCVLLVAHRQKWPLPAPLMEYLFTFFAVGWEKKNYSAQHVQHKTAAAAINGVEDNWRRMQRTLK